MWITKYHPFQFETYEDGNQIDLRIAVLKFPILSIVLGDDSFLFIVLGFGFILDW